MISYILPATKDMLKICPFAAMVFT